jgi:hypothetical protein
LGSIIAATTEVRVSPVPLSVLSCWTGKPFTKDMIELIRYKHKIDKPAIKEEH